MDPIDNGVFTCTGTKHALHMDSSTYTINYQGIHRQSLTIILFYFLNAVYIQSFGHLVLGPYRTWGLHLCKLESASYNDSSNLTSRVLKKIMISLTFFQIYPESFICTWLNGSFMSNTFVLLNFFITTYAKILTPLARYNFFNYKFTWPLSRWTKSAFPQIHIKHYHQIICHTQWWHHKFLF